jgi:hypothetical protein
MFYGFEEGITAIVGFHEVIVFVGEMERANNGNNAPLTCVCLIPVFMVVRWLLLAFD